MKKLIFAILFISIGSFTYGQYVPKGKTSKAEIALTKGELDIAKAEIDEAFKIDNKGKVTGAAKNWFTKGKIYKALYLDDSTEYKNLAGEEALGVAMEAFNKVNEAKTEEERAMNHFKIDEKGWTDLSDKEKKEKIDSLPERKGKNK